MNNEKTFVTIDHIDEYGGANYFKIGEELFLKKDIDNDYDDEAISVYKMSESKCGYIANSVETVARGTKSAGRIYDKIKDNDTCVVRFITEDLLIAELND